MSKNIRYQVERRAQGCCEYCLSQADFSPSSFSVEHIIPTVKGGPVDDLGNLAFACQGCNNLKFVATAAIDPFTNVAVPLFHPRTDTWSEHFEWEANFTLIRGITPTGRATVARLRLNRSNLVNYRTALVAFGKHPPATQ